MTDELSAFKEIQVTSSLDGSPEPSLLYMPEGGAKVLVVGLHTWSADRFNQVANFLPHCRERGWALVLPEFRGSNLDTNPRVTEACASPLARRDIVDAANWVIKNHFQERPATFLLGGSGGGHMSLMVAAREDFPWTAVSSWCPITDLAAWHGQNANYARHMVAACGGIPGASESVVKEYHERSPLNFVSALRDVRLQLAHGRHDKAVPYSHSWNLAQALIDAPHFYPWIFDGKHELRQKPAFEFFDRSLGENASAVLTG